MKSFLAAVFALGYLLCSHADPADHQTCLRGIVNLPGLHGAILEIDHAFYFAQTGDHFKDTRRNGEKMQIDVPELDLTNEIVKTRIDGEEYTNSLPAPSRPATATSWLHLQKADFFFVLELYQRSSDRVILLHPAVDHAVFSCDATWTNHVPSKAEISDCFAQLFKQRDAATLADGDIFLQILPTTMVPNASLRAKDLPPVAREKLQAGGIDFRGVDAREVVEIYGKLIARKRVGNEPVMGNIFFHNSQPLSKEEVIYALETLLTWNGIKIILNDDHTFSVAKAPAPPGR
jgi:hypothetical protein